MKTHWKLIFIAEAVFAAMIFVTLHMQYVRHGSDLAAGTISLILTVAFVVFMLRMSHQLYLENEGGLFTIRQLRRGRVYRVYPYPKLATAELGWHIFGLQKTHVDKDGRTCYDKGVTYFRFNYEDTDFTAGNEPKYVRLNSDSILEGVWVQKPGPNHD